MKLVKICKKPFIVQDEDRWGQLLPTFSVSGGVVGMVDEVFWADIKQFENYSNTPEGNAEQESAKEQLKSGAMAQDIEMPIMKRLFARSKHTLWEFNMQLSENPDENGDMNYVRSYATFDQPTLREYTPEHDKEVETLQNKCDEMNRGA